MSRRNTYLLGAVAAVVGIVMIVIAVSAMSGDGAGNTTTTPATAPPAQQGSQPSGEQAGGKRLADQLQRKGKADAPTFSLAVVNKGSQPVQVRRPLQKATTGGALSLERLRGLPAVLYMWSSKCVPCRADARLIQSTWERWGRRGVAFVGVSVDEPAQDALKFARRYRLTYPIVRDEGGRMAARYGATSLPETFFISSSGEVVGHVIGSPSVRQLGLGTASARAGRSFGTEEGGSREPLG
jgi:cytochrome c biogenesis protein CcmG/thiol:disulfide interchange protein DsbE